MKQHGILHRATSLVAAPVLLAMLPAMALAQEGPGGISYVFGLSQEFRTTSNPGLDVPAEARENIASTRLSFAFLSETATSRLAISAAGGLEAGDGRERGIATPRAELSYSRQSRQSVFDINLFLVENEVDTLDFFTGTDPQGSPIFTIVTGSGTQRRSGGTVKLELGREAPIGGSLSLGRTDTDYFDTTDPSLRDSSRDTARLDLRFDLSPVTRLTAGAAFSRLDEDGAPVSDTESLTIGLANDRPNGEVDIRAVFTGTETGNRQALTFGRSLDLPAGRLSLRLGASSQVVGGTEVIGGLEWQHDLPRGQIGVTLDRNVTGTDSDEESQVSRLGLRYAHAFTPVLTGSVNFGYQESDETVSGQSARTTDLSASLQYGLTQDWGLNFGASHRIRDESTTGKARSTSVFVGISRNFEFRP